MWRVDALLGIDGVFAYRVHDTYMFSAVSLFRYQEFLVILSTILTEANQKLIEVSLLYSFS